jgi:hypothetical protein
LEYERWSATGRCSLAASVLKRARSRRNAIDAGIVKIGVGFGRRSARRRIDFAAIGGVIFWHRFTETIVLQGGTAPTSPHHVHIDCSADGIPNKSPVPIFQPGRIVPQYVRRCSPTFSGAFVAHLEATLGDDAHKNALAAPVPAPQIPNDWLRMHLQSAKNSAQWMQTKGLPSWLAASRLDGFSAMIARALENPDPANAAIFQRYRQSLQPGLARLAQLLADES